MEYPLLIGGVAAGRLSVEKEGLYTVMEAWTEQREELLRIWVKGGGREAYLGIMQPWTGGMYLRRKLSRRELEDFPETIECATDQTGQPEERSGIESTIETVCIPEEPETIPECVDVAEDSEEDALKKPEEDPEGLTWFTRPDGSLSAFDGRRCLVALPTKMKRAPEGAVLREIEGKSYLVFGY